MTGLYIIGIITLAWKIFQTIAWGWAKKANELKNKQEVQLERRNGN